METVSTEIKQKISFKYYCELCDYGTCKKSNFNNHCESNKHIFNGLETNSTAIKPFLSSKKYHCDICNKNYTDRSGLWKHKKICIIEKEKEKDDDDNYYEGINIKDKDALVLHLLKQNGDLHNKLIEMSCKSNITNNNNSNSHNTTNNAFNLNFFLNETCKDAMNISDFVSSIKMSLLVISLYFLY